MSTHHITRLFSAGLLIAVLTTGAALGWPIWLWFLLPALCAGALLIDMRVPRSGRGRSERASESEETPPDRPEESPYQDTSVMVVPVESAVADCPFLFSATVWWKLVDEDASWPHRNPAALASTAILGRVQRMTSMEHPNRATFLEHSMEGTLGAPVTDDEGLVVAFATDIRLVLRQKDREHLEELDGLRKAVGTWESRRQHERNVREYLGDDVLQSPGSAVVWWMARHEDEIERAVEMIAPLTVLSAAANDEEIPENYRELFQPHSEPAEGDLTGGFGHPEPIGEKPVLGGQTYARSAQQQPSMSESLSDLLESMGVDEGSVEGVRLKQGLAQISDAVGRPEAAESIRRQMRKKRRDQGPDATGQGEDGPQDQASYAERAARMPPPREDGYRSAGGQTPRAGGWQVSPEGLVSEADAPRTQGGNGPAPDFPGPGPSLGEDER